jgi:hypothetical protein
MKGVTHLKCLREYSGVLDTAVTKVKSLTPYLGYVEDSHLEQRLDGVVFVDRGYNVASVTRLFFLGYVVKFFELR